MPALIERMTMRNAATLIRSSRTLARPSQRRGISPMALSFTPLVSGKALAAGSAKEPAASVLPLTSFRTCYLMTARFEPCR